ncbi:MAG: MFS transporter, partial [Bacteroidota bacterium]
AIIMLALSGLCCLLSPRMIQSNHDGLFISYLFFWGMVVIADSPMFSTLVAQSADSRNKGTALTIVNCVGFAITILSIQLLSWLSELISHEYTYIALALGRVLGLIIKRK